MASRMGTILIIGATAGIGEAFARRFHGLGKTVIATGRNQDKLDAMAKELPGLHTRQFDIADLEALPVNVNGILEDFSSLDTVIITAGTQRHFTLLDPSSIPSDEINYEITTNLTAPTLLIRLFVTHLMQLAAMGIKTTLFVTSSALAYVPLSFYPTYCAAKAGVQALVKILRQQLAFVPSAKDFCVVEIVPPYTDTGLDKAHREATIAIQGGSEKAFQAMPLSEFVAKFFESLEQPGPDGEIKKEIGVGFGEMGSTLWRDSFGKVYENMKIVT
ncbi:putative NAD -binding Rossmann-fold containing protein [Rosellinia necatrix]|uniref:Putative NAD-binding Rossmann-fold containing protein n=1 Tax=Rosellinia necatrix TaxID=77044 RepID=A0A1W2TQ83_ROSNE|nr:putative NAD -binding Rossmann-fold containing protein [Rosellinia necatrix]